MFDSNKRVVSIVLPTYNVGKYIERSLESCLMQTSRDFEVIIVDDRGSDDSVQKAKAYIGNDERFTFIENERNFGTYHARRIGSEKASGEYIIFLDPDDELHPKAVEMIQKLSEDQNPDMIFIGVCDVPKAKWFKKGARVPSLEKTMAQRLIVQKRILSSLNSHYGTPGKVYRKDFIVDVFKLLSVDHDKRFVYAEDTALFFSALLQMKSAIGINESLYYYHANIESVTKVNDRDSILFKIDQIEDSVGYINSARSNYTDTDYLKVGSGALEDLSSIFIKSLTRDKYYLERYLDEGDEHKMYLNSNIKLIKHSFDLNSIYRLLFFVISLGRVKL